MLQTILRFKKKLIAVITAVGFKYNYKRPFAKRIKRRHDSFWKSADAEKVRNSSPSSTIPLEKWKDVKNWQRKLSNKYNSREFAKLNGCKVANLYWKGRNVDTIEFDKLPQHYVIRPTIGHSCNLVFLMADTVNLLDKKKYSFENLKTILSKALDENPYLEFLIEEFVKTERGAYTIPYDYKFFTFNGEIAIIEVINRLGPNEGSSRCYDENWNTVGNISKKKYPEAAWQQPPDCFNEMIEQVKRLSKTYEIFVRIDFYATDKGAVFGEFTPTPGSAKYLTSKVEKMFIRYWDSYCNGRI